MYYATKTVPSVSYTIIHEYYTSTDGGEPVKDGETSGNGSAPLGTTITGSDIAKQLTYGDNTYAYVSADPASITLSEENGSYTITLRYERSTETPPPPPVDEDDYFYKIVYHYTKYMGDTVIGSGSKSVGPYNGYKNQIVSANPDNHTDYNGETYAFVGGATEMKLTNANALHVLDIYFELRLDPPVTTPPVTEPETTEPETEITEPSVPLDPPETTTEPPMTEPAETTTEPEIDIDDPDVPLDPGGDIPDTSDSSNIALFAATAVLSAMGLVVLTFRGRKKGKK